MTVNNSKPLPNIQQWPLKSWAPNEIRPIIYEFLKRGLVIPCTSPYNALILAVCVCVFSRV